ncbi:GbsR/MarR family transcriptional regulator [Geminisphaera colitermitum]|uniref:GbsR/MarR family transcriptional regulator n=1 Tax=Geminisphaera colitermitum TaxID=1148786 RepID=UPI000158CF2D|nr:transcriptional regulator [Geminisphaera colitermitum]
MPQSQPITDASADVARKEFDREVISFWVQVALQLGFPRSVGEIYGLVFLSEQPLSADDIVEKLGLSRSGAGQGLKVLQDIGAIKPAHQIASRKDHYQLQTDLGILVKLLLNARVLPQLEDLGRRRATLAATVAESGPPHLAHRFETIDRWRKKASPILSLVKGLAEHQTTP